MTIMKSSDARSRSSKRSALAAAASLTVVALTVGLPAAGAPVIPPPVPVNLEVEYGNTTFLVAHAEGTQNYVCLHAPGGFAWTFFGPQATLFDDADQQLITHFLSANPDENGTARATWQDSRDSSAVWARAVATSSDPAYVVPGSIPWLLLQVVGAENGPTGGASLSTTTFIQRVNTTGGVAPPADACARAMDIGKKALVPYTADYVFYKK